MADATNTTTTASVAPQPGIAPQGGIQVQAEIVAPVVLVIVGLISLVWKMLNDKIKRIEDTMKERQGSVEIFLEKLEGKIDKLYEKLTEIAVENAGTKSVFVTRDECEKCRKDRQ